MDMDHLDVTTAFLNGDLKEVIYMEQPTGFEIENKVCLLKKSIYGLKQASRAWNETVNRVLTKVGYVQLSCESCVYVKKMSKDSMVIVALYVDDFFIFSNHKVEKTEIIYRIAKTF